MRFLLRSDTGEFSLTKNLVDDDTIPPYAILSHTWTEGEEVDFGELMNGTGKGKSGYDKIQFCGEQARRDGLQYFWVDTCCINKSNIAELSEAINCMFRWYRDADKCYAYLSDVSSPVSDTNDEFSHLPCESTFRKSRWFTRGWTLQELLAPFSVEFFSREGNRLGDKRTLERKIHEITGIAIPALQGAPLSHFGVDERLSWAENRLTTRKEDQAYSLLGIFDVYMPLIYGEGRDNAFIRLREEIDKFSKSKHRTSSTTPENRLNKIYNTVLKRIVSPDYTDEKKEELYNILRHTLGSLVVLLSQLSISSLSRLIHCPKEDVDQILGDLHAIIDIPENSIRPLRLHYPSFRNFLLDKNRCGDSNFWVDEKQAHQTLAKSCIQLMSTCLKQDICGLDAPGVLVAEVESSRVKQCLPLEVQYACLYWVQHLQKSGTQLHDNGQVHQFLQTHFLHWLEALSWIGGMSKGIQAIRLIESINLKSDCPSLSAFIHDMKRFALYSQSAAIEEAPLQIYCGALIFAPTKSIIRKQFEDRIPEWMQGLHEVQEDWSAALQTLEGHTQWVSSVAFSPDGALLASGSADNTVRLWDMATGAAVKTLIPGRLEWPLGDFTGSVGSVAFSPDGELLASGSGKTVRLWDTATGAVVKTLEGHTRQVRSVVFSPDSAVLASGSEDKTVRLWDTATGAAVKTLKGVSSVAFSPDGALLALGSDDNTVRLWDMAMGVAVKTLKGHTRCIRSVAFSRDGMLLASGSEDTTVRLWDTATGAAVKTLDDDTSYVSSVAFSPDGALLASSSLFDNTVRLWDTAKGAVVKTLEGHTGTVGSVTFSPNGALLASGSDDETVKLWDTVGLWDTATGAAVKTLECHTEHVSSVAFSPDGALLASGSADNTVRLWDTSTGAAVKMLEGHTRCVGQVVFSPNGALLASGSEDETVRLWDMATGAAVKTLEGHTTWIMSIAFSPDSALLASGAEDKTARLWDTATGATVKTLKGHTEYVSSVAFSPNGALLVSGSDYNNTVRLWDTATGAAVKMFKGVSSIAFSLDGALLALGSDDNTVRLWNMATGAAVKTLKGHTFFVTSVAFSPDGALLGSASSGPRDKTVRLWDTATGAPLKTIALKSDVNILSFSPDGSFLETSHGLLSVEDCKDYYPHAISPRHISRPQVFLLDGIWVMRNSEKLLRLPPEYRGAHLAFKGNVLALGHSDGRVTIMKFG